MCVGTICPNSAGGRARCRPSLHLSIGLSARWQTCCCYASCSANGTLANVPLPRELFCERSLPCFVAPSNLLTGWTGEVDQSHIARAVPPDLRVICEDERTLIRSKRSFPAHSHSYNRNVTPEEELGVSCAGFAEF